MIELLEILKYILPALVVFGTSYYIIVQFFNNEQNKNKAESLSVRQKALIPTRIQAYERIVLFLERINPDSLIFRVQEDANTVREMQSAMFMAIRAEYEHNMSQQLYVSNDAWNMVKAAKEQVIKVINLCASEKDGDDSALALNTTIFDYLFKNPSPVQPALDFIKTEMTTVFGQ